MRAELVTGDITVRHQATTVKERRLVCSATRPG